MNLKLILLTALLQASSSEEGHGHHDHDHHDHGDHGGHGIEGQGDHGGHEEESHFEYAGAFDLEAGELYSLVFNKVKGSYAADTMKVVLLAGTAAASKDTLETFEEEATLLFEEVEHGDINVTAVHAGETMTVETETVYELEMDGRVFSSMFLVAASSGNVGHYLFMEHSPSEFETSSGGHWIKDDHGDDVEAKAEEKGHDHHDDEDEGLTGSKLWLYTLVGTFIGCMASLLAILLVSFGFEVMADSVWMGRICKGTSGVLMGVVTMHLIGEAGEYAGGWPHNMELGLCFSLGLFMTMLVKSVTMMLGGHSHGGIKDMEQTQDMVNKSEEMTSKGEETVEEQDVEASSSEDVYAGMTVERGVAWASIAGDVFHNFFDGVLVASAFNSCSSSLGWTVSVAVLIHELPQEVADFLVLRGAGWSVLHAAMANISVSLTALLGAIVYLAMLEEFSMETQGYFLAVSAGVFMFIGFELLAVEANNGKKGSRELLIQTFCWVCGLALMYFLMLWHPVCEKGDGHEGHNH